MTQNKYKSYNNSIHIIHTIAIKYIIISSGNLTNRAQTSIDGFAPFM